MQELLKEWFTPDVLYLVLLIISGLITIYIEFKRRGTKGALIAMMKSIQKHKDGEDDGLKKAAIAIAEAIKSDVSKESKIALIKKAGTLIDQIYNAEIKSIKELQNSVEEEANKEESKKEA